MTHSITTLWHCGECHYGECRILFIVMLDVVMLNVEAPISEHQTRPVLHITQGMLRSQAVSGCLKLLTHLSPHHFYSELR